jgi:glycosyltransferase involved in cell wall biosynthesis
MIKFSIIITCYNREKFISKCIRSALNQINISKDEYEVIVIDDNSHDDSGHIIKDFVPTIKFIKNKKNLGIASSRNDIVFLFMNQEPFCELKNIIFLHPNTDNNFKVALINTCDVMIHARERGETFGLAIGEFSSKNKPVITYDKSPERCHIDILGDKGLYYSDYSSLYSIINSINKKDIISSDWNCYKEYNPENIINQFKQVFIDD